MTIELTAELEATVLRLAQEQGITPVEVVAHGVDRLVWDDEDDPEERKIIAERIKDADRGDFYTQEEAHASYLAMLRPE